MVEYSYKFRLYPNREQENFRVLPICVQPLSRPKAGAVQRNRNISYAVPARQKPHDAQTGITVVEGSGFHLFAGNPSKLGHGLSKLLPPCETR